MSIYLAHVPRGRWDWLFLAGVAGWMSQLHKFFILLLESAGFFRHIPLSAMVETQQNKGKHMRPLKVSAQNWHIGQSHMAKVKGWDSILQYVDETNCKITQQRPWLQGGVKNWGWG